jgi:hypothetical protein
MEKSFKAIMESKGLKQYLRSWNFWRPFLGTFGGSVAGFLYYYYVGCSSGSCPITSHSYSSIIVGGLLGYLLIGSFFTKS